MKTIKVSIRDENTLVLQEDANKGDLIDLKSLHDLDIDKTTITAVVNSIRRKEFNDALQDALQKETEQIKRESDLRLEIKVKEVIAEKDQKITRLEDQIENSSQAQELAIIKAVDPIEKERDQIKIQKESIEISYKEEIERLKDMKTKLSTKMLGETLEQHCEIEFEKLRSTAFKYAIFDKDNDASSGSKGDYIYRESDEQGNEFISIMFEMKNENEETAIKRRNEDFLKELDKDRTEKKCEYAVLVSLLELESELYNTGIVDVSHRYNKMYVIRPQFFIPMITLLRNAALNSLQYKAELAMVRNQNIDVANFENELVEFKNAFGRSYLLAHDRFIDAIKNIDNSIAQLQKTKENLQKADDHYRIANNKAEDLTIKKLTKGNPTMAAKFDGLKKNQYK
ncbi:MAG: hypothetical protein ACD_37C00107G0003 [uncultured bacterium]|nr:MAG: hypothetical protein ACD_37C00107G0003 [uncultured bacterium]KKR16237.1 MAG: hypothetical protein UT46_C0007G0010 [Candidatus Levybacteria bacterium GW2011_GWA1_39_34]KKR49961.1 MAG: hypothetical protein UT87_C0022G0006 [Candidatus Levybacteria bacterium GW2011_GWC1_40_19]KKR94238.1 MAG: hypothetical protein UU45_C0013G0005 [Candidatus Levybacteria bacterium GW2011_GWA2_41_15]KKS01240.1 MAG: hypothetical protein UU52_C0015G0002 [Candidatus Levybacteria bacterium GW2011_GWB1_41_21]